jgi:adenosylcobinamide-phosphate synthase
MTAAEPMTAGQLLLACLLDVLVGDPRGFPHPVRFMGEVIAWSDDRIRPLLHSRMAKRAAGVALAIGLPASAYAVGWLAIEWAAGIHRVLGIAVQVGLAFTTLAARDLVEHVRSVQEALEAGSLEAARTAVSRIVGRDTRELSEPEVVRAAVETVAESTSDGVVAPLFYLALGGPPLALAYKAISTMDSMIGHLDERHRDFGCASARLDDLANWIPARVTALLLVLAAGLSPGGLGTIRKAWRVVRRDGGKHPSPNSGRPEAAMAGALGVQLGGTNVYDGRPVARPVLGDPGPPLAAAHIGQALMLAVMASLLAAGLAAAVRLV